MRSTTFRSAVSIVELVIGLASVAIGYCFLYQNLDCPPEVGGECTAWGLLGAVLFLFPGVIVALAGALSHWWKGIPFKNIQVTLIGVLIAYFLWMFASPWASASGQ